MAVTQSINSVLFPRFPFGTDNKHGEYLGGNGGVTNSNGFKIEEGVMQKMMQHDLDLIWVETHYDQRRAVGSYH